MATFQLTARRVVFAGGFALAIAIAPAVAVFSYPTADPAPRTLADPAQCTGGDSMDAYSLSCVPDIAPNSIGGAPSEMQLTEENPGMESPSHR
jgi:hypothetical protein